MLLIDRELHVEYANGRARELLGVAEHLDESPIAPDGLEALQQLAVDLFTTELPEPPPR